jgi:hypothetical protein
MRLESGSKAARKRLRETFIPADVCLTNIDRFVASLCRGRGESTEGSIETRCLVIEKAMDGESRA